MSLDEQRHYAKYGGVINTPWTELVNSLPTMANSAASYGGVQCQVINEPAVVIEPAVTIDVVANLGAITQLDWTHEIVRIVAGMSRIRLDPAAQAFTVPYCSGGASAGSATLEIDPPSPSPPDSDWRSEFVQDRASAARAVLRELRVSESNRISIWDRIEELVDAAVEEYPETDVPSVTSILEFSRILRVIQPAKAPSLSLTPGGGLLARWKDGRAAALVSISRKGRVSGGYLLPDPERPWQPKRGDYVDTSDEVAQRLRAETRLTRVFDQ